MKAVKHADAQPLTGKLAGKRSKAIEAPSAATPVTGRPVVASFSESVMIPESRTRPGTMSIIAMCGPFRSRRFRIASQDDARGPEF